MVTIDALVIDLWADKLSKQTKLRLPKDVVIHLIHGNFNVGYPSYQYLQVETERFLRLDELQKTNYKHFVTLLRRLATAVGVDPFVANECLRRSIEEFNFIIANAKRSNKGTVWVKKERGHVLAIAGNNRFIVQRLGQIKPSDFKASFRPYRDLSPSQLRFYKPVLNHQNNLFYWDNKAWEKLTQRY